VTLLASRPKLGKSWLVLDLCVACAGDRFTLGQIKPVAGDVLYLALEDNPRRLQRRLDRLMRGADAWPARLTLTTQWRRANEGGLADIEEWCGSVLAPRLVVIDTLEKIRPPGGSGPLYSADYLAITGLHRIASEKGLAIVVVHHDRKADGEDPFDTVSGTLGLVGAADTVLLLKRRPTGTVLYARGRDIEESETAVQFNKATCRWTMLGPAAEVHRSNERARVLEVLAEAGRPLPIKEIQTRADLPSRNATDTLLFRMVEAGEIRRVAKGVYGLIEAEAAEGPEVGARCEDGFREEGKRLT
jgi:RecA-family ATPase